jgi:GNAT superfamily N-acetyltransferase
VRGAVFVVRRVRPDELGEAAALYERVATSTLHWMPAGTHTAAGFLSQAGDETVFVAMARGRVVGLAALYEPESFLHSLYVDAAWQGRGIGTALLAVAAEAASGPLSLKVEERNGRARTFYERLGFAEGVRGEEAGSIWIRLTRG